ncbi:hypothetical protein GXW71_32480 [Roseomonas hellenica]|uniref:Uncharacterized protein n=1 Tax=Plastoroseomonas hellenica TaxID=2687306 RepID=A0ABS5F981_9PROT|nr:hypothetical protein [Plastoroseomonas hellenica]MBR0669112.1 hypothetical protein [Plastoroseomonas hellenica]
METQPEFEAAAFADHLVLMVFVLALAMQWLMHRITKRLSDWRIVLPVAVAATVWAAVGWMLGGGQGVFTFLVGLAFSLTLAVLDERTRQEQMQHPARSREDSMRFS